MKRLFIRELPDTCTGPLSLLFRSFTITGKTFTGVTYTVATGAKFVRAKNIARTLTKVPKLDYSREGVLMQTNLCLFRYLKYGVEQAHGLVPQAEHLLAELWSAGGDM